MQTPSSLHIKNGHIYMTDAQCSETKENPFCDVRVFIFEICSILYSKFTESSKYFDLESRSKMSIFCPKICAMFWTECRTEFQIFAIFSFWDMVAFILNIPSEGGGGKRRVCISLTRNSLTFSLTFSHYFFNFSTFWQ